MRVWGSEVVGKEGSADEGGRSLCQLSKGESHELHLRQVASSLQTKNNSLPIFLTWFWWVGGSQRTRGEPRLRAQNCQNSSQKSSRPRNWTCSLLEAACQVSTVLPRQLAKRELCMEKWDGRLTEIMIKKNQSVDALAGKPFIEIPSAARLCFGKGSHSGSLDSTAHHCSDSDVS